jgi:hypothetical protein
MGSSSSSSSSSFHFFPMILGGIIIVLKNKIGSLSFALGEALGHGWALLEQGPIQGKAE